MTLRHGVLCLLALITIVLLAFENHKTWTARIEPVFQKAGPKKVSVKPEGSKSPVDQKDSNAQPSITSYIFIAEKNPFHPDRKEFPIPEVPKVEVKKPIVRPQVTLYGVTIVEDYRSATISFPGKPLQQGEKETMTVRVGGQVGEYRVSQILQDRIGLKTEEDSFEVLLYDTKTPKKRTYVKTENRPASVVSTAPGSAGTIAEGAKPLPGAVGALEAPKTTPVPSGVAPTRTPSPSGIASPPAPTPPGVAPPAASSSPGAPPGTPASRTRRFQPTAPGGQ
jgi:hypothetical protein